MTDDDNPPWHILRTEPNSERRAAEWLAGPAVAAVYDVYLPMELKFCRPRIAGRRQPTTPVERPLIPGYLFAKVNHLIIDWGRVRASPGVLGLLMFNGAPATLTEHGIEAVRMIEADQRKPPSKRAVHRFKVGQVVSIAEGLFAGYRGIIQRLDKNDKAVLELVSPGTGTLRDASCQWLCAVNA